MSYENVIKPQSTRCQVYYSELYNKLLRFFNLALIIIIILSFVLIFFSNELQNSHQKYQSHQVPYHTKQHIDHYFRQTQNQLYFISKTTSKILDLQYQSYQNKQKLFYQQRAQLTTVQKMLYLNKYNTTGEYNCIGNCTVNLWAKRVSFHSIASIYMKYYDPISNSTNIIYTPKDRNILSQKQIQQLLTFTNKQQNISLVKIQKGVYFRGQFMFDTSFDSQYKIQIAIQLRKSQMERILRSDIQLFSFYHYQIYDSFQWIYLSAQQSLPVFSYKTKQTICNISYQQPYSNKTLITFYFQMPQIVIYFSFIKFSLILPILVFIFLFFDIKNIIKNALFKFFKNTKTLLSLYQYNIQQIFTGNQPKQTIILTDTTITQFYQQLSQLPTSQYQPIVHKKKKKVPFKSFLFVQTLKAIVQKYNNYAKTIFKQKNKEIMNNKFFIHTSVNELSQAESHRIKQQFNKARQLGTLKRFFKYGYLSLLLTADQLDRIIEQDSQPLPQQFIQMTREINRTVSGTDVRRAFQLSPGIMKQTQEQLQIRIQVNLLQKYIQILKELDIHNFFAKQLRLQYELQNLNQYIQNIKHLLNKHNKNIRTLGR